MEEILFNYQGIIGAIAGTVLGTVTTLITTHVLRNYGKVEATIFGVEFETFEQDPYNPNNSIRIDFKVKFYNTSESNKVLDNVEIVYLDHKNRELYSMAPDDVDTLRITKYSAIIDELFFVNLPPKQLTLKKLRVEVTDQEISDLDSVKTIKLRYVNKRKKHHVIYKRK